MKIVKKAAFKTLSSLTNFAINNRTLRHWLIKNMEARIYKDLIKENPDNRPIKVQEDKYYMGRALLRRIDKVLTEGHLSRKATE